MSLRVIMDNVSNKVENIERKFSSNLPYFLVAGGGWAWQADAGRLECCSL